MWLTHLEFDATNPFMISARVRTATMTVRARAALDDHRGGETVVRRGSPPNTAPSAKATPLRSRPVFSRAALERSRRVTSGGRARERRDGPILGALGMNGSVRLTG